MDKWVTLEEKIADYEVLLKQLEALFFDERDKIANLSNSSALLNQFLPDTVFAGYYLFNGEELVLGPFQGGVSCVRIKLGKGVCGISAKEKKTVIVDDVKKFANYISCDAAAKSEIVVPLLQGDKLLGVLDIDAGVTEAYDEVDEKYLGKFAEKLVALTDF
ncbi:MAG: GAF domain-containing protein [Lactobacillales bacterium]|nr:GAF domain-containing protein [Lactobacillales bacterium]